MLNPISKVPSRAKRFPGIGGRGIGEWDTDRVRGGRVHHLRAAGERPAMAAAVALIDKGFLRARATILGLLRRPPRRLTPY